MNVKNLVKYVAVIIVAAIIIPFVFPVIGFWKIVLILSLLGFISWLQSQPRIKFVGTILTVGLVVLVFYHAFTSYLPMTSKSAPWQLARADYELSSLTDSIALKTDLTWDAYRAKHSEAMLTEYRRRLSLGDPEGAAKVEEEFFNKWDKSRVLQKGWDDRSSLKSPKIEAKPDLGGQVELLIDARGRYYIAPAGQETGLVKIGECLNYHFSNENGERITLYYPDGTHANSWEIAKWPNKTVFKIKNWSEKDIALIVI